MNKLTLLLTPIALAVTACETYPPSDDPYGPGGYPPSPYPQEPYPPYPPYPPGPPGPPMAGVDAPSLDRTRWSVVAVNGRPTPPGDYFVEFDNGRLSAKFGCNGIGAGYAQTGSTLDAGALIATRMACPDMSFENQGSGVLDQPMTIEWLANDRIALNSSAGRLDLVRR